MTALLIAALRASESTRPDSLFGSDPLAEAVDDEIDTETAQLWVRDGTPTPIAAALRDYVAMRTRWFDGYLARAAAEGIGQVVLLGAGLDGRPYRLTLPGVTVFAVDTAGVTDYRRSVVERHGLPERSPVRSVVSDLAGEGWEEVLLAAGFDRAAPTAWLAEGLLFYLPAADCSVLIRAVTDLSAPGSRIALEYPHGDMAAVLEELDSGGIARQLIGELLESGPPSAPAAWLTDNEWSVEMTDDVAGWARALDRTPPAWSTARGFTWWFAAARLEHYPDR
ncbi:SAM-dependent methyltransferase [Actinomycetospora sp. OC33-EN08]|uniref:S-adenosyl-L-methionine-dependent methyltransferase n=1 Tax=Actinomycetospora aurantiaca TaxID=3129233 RepID=A0ABU8MT58_9PSEU